MAKCWPGDSGCVANEGRHLVCDSKGEEVGGGWAAGEITQQLRNHNATVDVHSFVSVLVLLTLERF
jgi:hypothetical protein